MLQFNVFSENLTLPPAEKTVLQKGLLFQSSLRLTSLQQMRTARNSTKEYLLKHFLTAEIQKVPSCQISEHQDLQNGGVRIATWLATASLSTTLDSVMAPLVQQLPSYAKDTSQTLQILESFTFRGLNGHLCPPPPPTFSVVQSFFTQFRAIHLTPWFLKQLDLPFKVPIPLFYFLIFALKMSALFFCRIDNQRPINLLLSPS